MGLGVNTTLGVNSSRGQPAGTCAAGARAAVARGTRARELAEGSRRESCRAGADRRARGAETRERARTERAGADPAERRRTRGASPGGLASASSVCSETRSSPIWREKLNRVRNYKSRLKIHHQARHKPHKVHSLACYLPEFQRG